LVADAWFAKRTFAYQVLQNTMHLISRLREDADLCYLYLGKPTGKRGRKKYDGKFDNSNIDVKHFMLVSEDDEALVNSDAVIPNL